MDTIARTRDEFNTADPALSEDQAVRVLVQEFGYSEKRARREVRAERHGPPDSRRRVLPDGTVVELTY
jgi:hypothetical protein